MFELGKVFFWNLYLLKIAYITVEFHELWLFDETKLRKTYLTIRKMNISAQLKLRKIKQSTGKQFQVIGTWIVEWLNLGTILLLYGSCVHWASNFYWSEKRPINEQPVII